MAYGTINAEQLTTQSGYTLGAGNASSFKNRIINGAMVIDQRNAGASVSITASPQYTLDRWAAIASLASKFSIQQNAGAVTPPSGFINYLGATSSSAYSVGASEQFAFRQSIEGLNVADLAWGTASAQTVTLSFWARSSLTGTFGGVLQNSAGNRSYPYTYTISAANTWEQKSVTIAGDTSGTWLTTNGIGVIVQFGLGVGTTLSGTAGAWSGSNFQSATGATSVVGTNGATFYITGVQLEVGTVATSFDFRSYTTELGLCQRYFESCFPIGTAPASNVGYVGAGLLAGSSNGSSLAGNIVWKVTKRTQPVVTFYRPDAAGSTFDNGGTALTSGINDSGMLAYTTTLTNSRTQVNWAVTAEL